MEKIWVVPDLYLHLCTCSYVYIIATTNLPYISPESSIKQEHLAPYFLVDNDEYNTSQNLDLICEDGAETESSDLRFKLSKLGREVVPRTITRTVPSRIGGVRDLREKLSTSIRVEESPEDIMAVDVPIPKRRITSVVTGGTRSFGIRVQASPGAARQVVRQVAVPASQVAMAGRQVAVGQTKVREQNMRLDGKTLGSWS